MIDPYRMVVVSGIASLVVIIGLLIYTKVFKKKLNLFYVLLIISLLPLISVLRKGSYESGDLSLHAKFAMQFYDNLVQGNVVPQWVGNHCAGYGCPVYIFLFILPYYLISLFHFVGFSFIASVKILISLSFITSGIGMYYWIKDELGKVSGFTASIFYLFAPYHLIDLHFRVSIGELLSMAILPFVFLLVKRVIETGKAHYVIGNGVVFALLILSHQVTSFISLPLAFLYGILVWCRDKKRRFVSLFILGCSLLLGILLSAFYWIPIVAEGKLTHYGNDGYIGFHPLSSFLYSENRFGLLFQGHHGEFYFNVGYTEWLVIIASVYLLFKHKLPKKEHFLLLSCMALFAIFFFLMQSISKPIWNVVPLIKNFQFSWRLLIEVMLFVAIMGGILVKRFPNKIFITLLCAVTILYTILNWGNRKAMPQINDTVLRSERLFAEWPGVVELTTPIWVDKNKPWIGTKPKYPIDVLSGKAEITVLSHKMTAHEYSINALSPSIIKENTYYYPGWKVTVNNKEVPIFYTQKDYPGVITFNVPKGKAQIKVFFTDTFDRKMGKLITLLSFLGICIYVIFYFIKKHFRRATSSSKNRIWFTGIRMLRFC